MLLMSTICGAMAQNDAMYVYRNDGVINAFLKADVDSMRYSQLDLDSVFHNDYVVQEVWAVDSIYRIPLEKIDSVSFVTPKTVFKSDVVNLDNELLGFIIGADKLTLKLKTNTPSSIIPQANDKLVLLDGVDVLPDGFAGKVMQVNYTSESIVVECERAYIEDIFDSFCSVQTVCGYSDESAEVPVSYGNMGQTRAVYNPADRTIKLGPYSATASGELSQGIIPNGELVLKGGASLSVTLEPTFRIHTFLIVGEGYGFYFNSSITGNLEVSSSTSIYGGLEWEHEFLNPVINFPIPQTAGLVNFYINPGLFIRANAMVTTKLSTTRNYSFGMAYDFSSIGQSEIEPSLRGRLVSTKTDMTGSIDGSLAIGAYFETGFNLVSRELSRVCIRGELGAQVNGNFVLRNSDIDNASKETVLYERLKASSVEFGPFVSASLVASVINTSASPSWQLSSTAEKWDLVPTFANTKLTHTHNSNTSLDAYTELSGNCILPVPVGYKLFDANNTEIADYNASSSYTNRESRFEHTFNGVGQGDKYIVYPKIRIFDYDILASPSAELNSILPDITDFKVTKSSFSQGAYYNDGRTYDYKFEVSTTVEIESLDGVSEWGYAYKDPYGNITHIPLSQFGTSYTDTRYVYYRNEPKSSVCLYGYVKYEGSDEYIYGDSNDYPLETYDLHVAKYEIDPNAKFENDSVIFNINVQLEGDQESLKECSEFGYYINCNNDIQYFNMSQMSSAYNQIGAIKEYSINGDLFNKIDYNSFVAEATGCKIGAYVVDQSGNHIQLDEKDLTGLIYDRKPSIKFDAISITGNTFYYNETEDKDEVRTSYSESYSMDGTFWMTGSVTSVGDTSLGRHESYKFEGLNLADESITLEGFGWGSPNETTVAYYEFELKNGQTKRSDNSVFFTYGTYSAGIK